MSPIAVTIRRLSAVEVFYLNRVSVDKDESGSLTVRASGPVRMNLMVSAEIGIVEAAITAAGFAWTKHEVAGEDILIHLGAPVG